MNGYDATLDGFEQAILERDSAQAAIGRHILDAGKGDVMRMESDCCGSNNYPERPQA